MKFGRKDLIHSNIIKQIKVACVKYSPISFLKILTLNNDSSKSLFKYSFWSLLSSIFSRFFTLFAWIVVARILQAEEYGQIGIIRSTANTFILFAGFGLGVTATRFLSDFKNQPSKFHGEIIGLTYILCIITGSIISILNFSFSFFISSNILHAPYLFNEIRWTSLLIFLSAFNGAQTGILNGLSEYKVIARLSLINGIISLPVIVAGAYFEKVTGTVISLIIVMLVNVVSYHLVLVKIFRRNGIIVIYRFSKDVLKLISEFSLPALLSSLLVNPVRWVCNAMLVREINGFFELGVFTAIIVIQNFILLTTSSLNAPFINLLSRNSEQKDDSLEWLNIYFGWILGVGIIELFLIFNNIGTSIFGQKYTGSSFNYTYSIVLLYTCIILFKQGLARLMIVKQLMWFSFLSNFLWGVVVLFSFFILRKYGATGLSISFLIGYIVNVLIIIPYYIRKQIISKALVYSKSSNIAWLGILLFFILSLISNNWWISLILFIGLWLLQLKFIKQKFFGHEI